MINYVYAFICSVIFYVLIQYYINNYSSDDQKQVLNFGNNKILLFIGILFNKLYIAIVIAVPADGPSLETAPSGQCIWRP